VNEDNRGPDGVRLVRDDALTNALREVYRAPADEGYWVSLERRIMLAIDEQESWWTVPDRWVRVGLAAAAAALVIAGGLFLREQAGIDRTMAAESVVEVEGLESALAQREPLSQEEATLRKLVGNK
jgi:hypothetical protein